MKAKNIYDHRLKAYVRKTGDLQIAINQGVPRSTAYRWVRSSTQSVVSLEYFNYSKEELEFEVIKLKKQIEILRSILKIIILALRASDFSFTPKQINESKKRTKLIHAIDEVRELIPISKVLKVINISAARFHSWKSKEIGCNFDNIEICPGRTPNKLTSEEIHEIRKMATSDEYRHVSTGTLSLLAQRLGKVFASPSTWYRLIKERGWRRPRTRIHPSKPRLGIRASNPNQVWHIDTTIIRLLNGTRIYLHAVIDNFSRKILGWKVANRFEVKNLASVLLQAITQSKESKNQPTLLVDGGVENFNSEVDALIDSGLLKRLLAQTEISYSNSMIESWWKSLKHQWLYLNSLDSETTVKRLVSFYVDQHNNLLPHSAFKGQTPDEMYLRTSDSIESKLAQLRLQAKMRRHSLNRSMS